MSGDKKLCDSIVQREQAKLCQKGVATLLPDKSVP